MIQQVEDKTAAFQFFLENADKITTSGEKEAEAYFTVAEWQRLSIRCDQLASGVLDNIIGCNPDKETFYSELWRRGIESDINFSDEKEKIYILYRFWIDGRIPYIQLEKGLYMSEEDYAGIMREKEEEIKKAGFILNCRFSQKTERSSLLVDLLDTCKAREEKAVVLAQILSMTENKSYMGFYPASEEGR